jgi:hypothetical protein
MERPLRKRVHLLSRLFDSLLPVGSLRYHFHIWLTLDEGRVPWRKRG